MQPVHEVKGFVSNLNGGRGFPKVFKRNANLTSLHQVCVCVCVCVLLCVLLCVYVRELGGGVYVIG